MKSEHIDAEEAAVVQRLLAGLVGVVCRFPWLVLAAGLGLCALAVHAACTRLEYHTQRSDLVSPHKDYQRRWRQYLAEFGDDDDIVVVVKGADRGEMRRALDALAARVGQQPQYFDRLF